MIDRFLIQVLIEIGKLDARLAGVKFELECPYISALIDDLKSTCPITFLRFKTHECKIVRLLPGDFSENNVIIVNKLIGRLVEDDVIAASNLFIDSADAHAAGFGVSIGPKIAPNCNEIISFWRRAVATYYYKYNKFPLKFIDNDLKPVSKHKILVGSVTLDGYIYDNVITPNLNPIVFVIYSDLNVIITDGNTYSFGQPLLSKENQYHYRLTPSNMILNKVDEIQINELIKEYVIDL